MRTPKILLLLFVAAGCASPTLQAHPPTFTAQRNRTPEQIAACVRKARVFTSHPYTVVDTPTGKQITTPPGFVHTP